MSEIRTNSQDPVRRVAAIDVGSNSTHMLIVETSRGGGFQVLESMKEQTRLAADIDERLMLDSNALNKMVSVLKRMREVAEKHKAVVRCIATHPLREARNGAEFAARLSTRSGVLVEIVSGQEEARLVSLGVRLGLPIASQSTLIVDVGGGSAEIILCQWDEVRFATSLKLGAVRLTQKFLASDPFSARGLKELEDYVVSRLEPVSGEIKRFGFDAAVASSGTVKALKSLAMGMHGEAVPAAFHGTTLKCEDLFEICEVLFGNRSLQERKMLPRMDPKRADIIVAGAMVLKVLAKLANVQSFTLSTTALREGILVDTLAREETWLRGDSRDVRWQSVKEFGAKHRIDEPHAFHIASLTMALFDSLAETRGFSGQWRELLRCAAYLHESGRFVNVTGHHKHAHYLVRNSSLMGFSQRELEIIATLIRFHRKRAPRTDENCMENFDPDDLQRVTKLSSLLRLAVSMDRGRLGRVRQVKLAAPRGGKILLTIFASASSDAGIEIYELNCEKAPFERAFGVSLEVRVEEYRV
ncbi:Ppx/GppA family phosphatase [bacterium]|nr:Ppx/GppA family phosphatase [bacterium]